MVDDYKYSIGRNVVYRHREPGRSRRDYGQYGPDRTIGRVRTVDAGTPPEHVWVYTVENLRTGETAKVPETDILYASYAGGERKARHTHIDAEKLAEELARSVDESPLATFLRMHIEESRRREESEAAVRREGRDLPIAEGDYIRVRGELRSEVESCHNHYAKVLEVTDPDVAAIESPNGPHTVRRRYVVQIDDGRTLPIYDPEVKLYYTAEARRVILNWRAAKFLAESFGDDPPYSVEYSYLEDHVYSRDELEAMSKEELMDLFAAMLYVKGRMGLRDLENKEWHLASSPREYLVDGILAISRFDMLRNRALTPGEVDSKKRDVYRLRRILRGR
jgi:hypothetical protein